MESNTTSKKVLLRSSDGEEFIVNKEVAELSKTIRHLIEEDCAWDANPIPIYNATGNILAKVMVYCRKHAQADAEESNSEELDKWDKEYLDVDHDTLYDLIMAANYLDIRGLLDLTCEKVANMIKGKSPEEIRATFDIENDFSPEEEEEMRRENSWAFD